MSKMPAVHEGSIRESLQAASLLIAQAEVRRVDGGWAAAVVLDALMVKIRGTEQGLADASLAAAVTDPRIHHALDAVRRKVNAELAPRERIVSIEIAPGDQRLDRVDQAITTRDMARPLGQGRNQMAKPSGSPGTEPSAR